MRRSITMAMFLSLFAVPVCCGAESTIRDDSATKGYNCLFMGHSFFAPIARSFAAHPGRCSFSEHKQTVVFHGGMGGAPGRLWKSPREDVAKAKKLLDTGTVDLLGLTYYTGVESDFSDYRTWVDLALKHNPNTRFVIQAPWTKYKNKTLARYEADSERSLKHVHDVIDELRGAYPENSFLCIPQGRWMVGLWRLFNEGKLPEVSEIKRSDKKGKESCLFTDITGHGGPIPVKMGALLWLATIYKVDLNEYQWKTNTTFDLKQLAQEIVQNDPYCGLKPKEKAHK